MKYFNLPEKWFIKQTPETYDIINNWLNKNCEISNEKGYKTTNNYIYYPATNSSKPFYYGNHSFSNIQVKYKDYVEISFEQFKKSCLNHNEINNNYEIF